MSDTSTSHDTNKPQDQSEKTQVTQKTEAEGGQKEGKGKEETEEGDGGHNDSVVSNPDPYFTPIVSLPEVKVNTGEDDETEIFKIRSRLYRFAVECDPPEWKERGTGDIRILQHKTKNTCRIVMRREKTMKLCANHFIQPWMQLNKHTANEKTWVWNTYADFADEEKKPETLAAKFSTIDNAAKWKTAFEKAVKFVLESEAESYLKERKNKEMDKLKDMGQINTKDDKTEVSSENKENQEDTATNTKTEDVENKLNSLTVT